MVSLVRLVQPPIANVPVYFKLWDVDDPFNELNATMPDVNLIDDDTSGPDNRPTGEAPETHTEETNEYGQATWTVTVSMQPGNNYRAAASCLDDAPDQVDQTDADALSVKLDPQTQTYLPNGNFSGYHVPVVWSKMLTVWRKLWIERDTMRAPGLTEFTFSGTAGTVVPNVPVTGQATIDLGANLPDEFSDLNLYEEGSIRFLGCPVGSDTFPIVESTSYLSGHDEVIVLGVPAACATGSSYLLRDDDDVSGVLPHFPDGGSLLPDAFADAYIHPQYAGRDYQTVVDFDLHLSDWAIEHGSGPWDDGRVLYSSASFWSCFMVGCWEASQNWDADPDLCFSLTPPYTARSGYEGVEAGCTDDDSGRIAIYMQTLADDAACLNTTDEAHTVTHEIGHSCGSHHDHIPGSIMEDHAPTNCNDFAAESIKIFRSELVW